MIAGLIMLGILLWIAILPIGVRASYDANGALLQLMIGPVRIQLFPGRKNPPNKKSAPAKGKTGTPSSNNGANTGGSLSDLLPILRVVWDLLKDFKRKLRVDRLEFRLVLADDDPCDLSLQYGRAWAALGNLMPRLESFLSIRERDLEIECDYLAQRTTVYLLIDLSMTVGRFICLAARHGFRGLIEYRKLLKIRKGGA